MNTKPYVLTAWVLAGCGGGGGGGDPSTQTAGASQTTAPADSALTLSWTPPTTNSDGTALTDLAGYRLYYGKAPEAYDETLDIASPGITEYVIEPLSPGTYYFVVTAYDEHGNESAPSNTATGTID